MVYTVYPNYGHSIGRYILIYSILINNGHSIGHSDIPLTFKKPYFQTPNVPSPRLGPPGGSTQLVKAMI